MYKYHKIRYIFYFLWFGIVLVIFSSCNSVKISKAVEKSLETDFFKNQFTGLMVYNPKTKDTIVNYNATKYFTPASNVKLATLYTALHYLPDSIPAFRYVVDKDTLFVKGTGDPSFLHPYFKDSTALRMFARFKTVKLVLDNLSDHRYGPGWSWDDFDKHYSPERSSFPMYGNVVLISNTDSTFCTPRILKNKLHFSKSKIKRAYNTNEFYYPPRPFDKEKIPLVMDSLLIASLWQDLLPGKVQIVKKAPKMTQTASSVPTDSVLKRMMLVSDNFLAEQLLIVSSSKFSNRLSSYWMRQQVLKNELADLHQKPRWVDGSGLSRYNLFTPASLVQILTKLYEELPEERLFNLFPAGGEGTL
ncbi:MAG TPA: D-alanyl-D-alanine carboxypeptidase, partial [Saprospiraceae bacterium]|nr:D-alanyl-D-alanine carboxypeptidase [Saprospiraceae bacterium]